MHGSKCSFIQPHAKLFSDTPRLHRQSLVKHSNMGKFFFGFLNDVLVTVEEFIDGHFAKYINGDGKCKTLPLGDMKHAYQKAQPLVYCSYKLSKRKFMLLDIRENMNNL